MKLKPKDLTLCGSAWLWGLIVIGFVIGFTIISLMRPAHGEDAYRAIRTPIKPSMTGSPRVAVAACVRACTIIY